MNRKTLILCAIILQISFQNSAPSAAKAGDTLERIWQAKIIGEDERFGTYLPYMGAIFTGPDRSKAFTSSFVVGRNQVVSAAHTFAAAGKWAVTQSTEKPTFNDFGRYWVFVQGCGRKYQVKNVEIGTLESKSNTDAHKDYAVVEVTEDFCKEARPLTVGAPSYDQLAKMDIDATRYYRPETVDNSNGEFAKRLVDPNDVNGLGQMAQFTGRGKVIDTYNHNGQRIDYFDSDMDLGGSGGPITAIIEGKTVVVGMQYASPSGDEFQYSFSMTTEGPFLEFLKRNVPDLKIYCPRQKGEIDL